MDTITRDDHAHSISLYTLLREQAERRTRGCGGAYYCRCTCPCTCKGPKCVDSDNNNCKDFCNCETRCRLLCQCKYSCQCETYCGCKYEYLEEDFEGCECKKEGICICGRFRGIIDGNRDFENGINRLPLLKQKLASSNFNGGYYIGYKIAVLVQIIIRLDILIIIIMKGI